MKIMMMDRLLHSIENMGSGSNPMDAQLASTRARLSSGVDINGLSFAPYKTKRPTNHSRPLEHAAKLYEDTTISSQRSLDGVEYRMSISGRAATIAYYQNFKRTFSGFSSGDRDQAKEELRTKIAEGMKQC